MNRETRTILPDPDGSAGQLARPWTARAFDQRGFLVSKTDLGERTTIYSNDLFGRPRLITNAAGGTQGYVYDAAGNVVYATDALGRRTFFAYDTMNRPVAVRAPRPDASAATPVTTSTYDVTGNLVRSTDALNRTTWRQYDLLGRLTAETDPLGVFSGDSQHTTHTEYDSAGRVTATVDALGRRTDTVYDNLGRRIRVLEPNVGQARPTTHYGYDAAGNLRFTTDPRGAAPGATDSTTWMFYDALGRQTATVDAMGTDWPVTAIPDTLPSDVTSNVSRTVYDLRGRIASTIDALNQKTDYGYDNLGRMTTETAPAPNAQSPRPVTVYGYDASGNRTSVYRTSWGATLSIGETYAYDALNRRTTVTDGRGFKTVTTYDLVGNVASVTDASTNVTRYAYDRLNRLVAETDPLGAVTTSAYDLVGNKTRETDRLNRVTSFVYDAADRLVEERWQASPSTAVVHTIKRIYDPADQLLGVTETDTANSAATTSWQFTYDAAGNVVKSRMAPGELTQIPQATHHWNPPGSLDPADRVTDWDGDSAPERYDTYSLPVSAIGDQVMVSLSSEAFDPVVFVQRPNGSSTTWIYDDSSGGGTSARLVFTADLAGEWLIVVTTRDPAALGTYDLQYVVDQNAIVPTALVEYDFAYDKAGNLLLATEDQAAVADMFMFGSNLGKAASGLGMATSYTVNALDQVAGYRQLYKAADGVADVVAKRVLYTYRAEGTVGSVARFAAAGVSAPVGTSAATYDFTGRLTGITHIPAATGSLSVSYGYTYDAAGRIQTMTTPEGTSTFALDAADQLSSASLTGETYAYDNTGNRTNGGTQTGPGNRLTFDGTYRYAYDAEGNRTVKFRDTNTGGVLSAGDTDVAVYGYDQRNRLVAVSHVNAWTAAQATSLGAFTSQGTSLPGSDLELRYTYDYADRRIRRSMDTDGAAGASAESVSFAAYAGDARTLEIARPNDKLVIDSVRGPIGFLGQVIQRNVYGNGADEILAVDKITWNGTTPTTSTFWTFTDHQDTVRDIVSGNATDRGQVVEHRQYDSFGKIVTQTTSAATTPGIDFGYTGRPLESRTGLSDNRARWYEPATGRFITEDPSGFNSGDANFYRYVGNDPLDKVDPSGLTGQWASGAKASVPAATWAGLGQGAMLTTSGSRLGSGSVTSMVLPTAATPTFSIASSPLTVSTSGGTVYSPAAATSYAGSSRASTRAATSPSTYDRVSLGIHSTLSAAGAIPGFGVVPDAIDWVYTLAELPFGKSTRTDLALATAGIFATAAPVVGDGPAAALKVAARASRVTGNVAADVARVAGRVDDAAAFVNNAARVTPGKYTVGAYDDIRGTVPGLDAHHVGQKAVMRDLVPGYDPATAPSILVPKAGHTKVGPTGRVSTSTEGFTRARDVVARDIRELRRVYPDIPNSQLQQLIQMNKDMYPVMNK